MADQDTATRKMQKFLFDVHNFDEPDGPDPNAPPPPPMFSQADIDAARLQAFEKGREAGLAEAEASRARFVAGLTDTIERHFTVLFDAEKKRADQYESEVMLVVGAVFKKLFPNLNTQHGLDEMEAMIRQVLANQRHQSEITIEVNPEFIPDIRALADDLQKRLHGAGTINVIGKESLSRGDCLMSWNDGGAERSATALAAEIQKTIDETLAGRPRLRDNGEEAQGE